MFEASVRAGQREVMAKFYVANEIGKFLLGYETAKLLGVLKIGIDNVNNINDENPKELSKIKGISIEIPMKADIKPVQQQYRRIPAPLEKLVDEKISKMLRQDIIEKVEANWISPLVITPKPNNDVRVCVDMRRVNESVNIHYQRLKTFYQNWPKHHFSRNWTLSKHSIKLK